MAKKVTTYQALQDLQQSVDLHRVLHSAYTYVRSQEMNAAVAGLTLDHFLKRHIDSLKQGETRQLVDPEGNSTGKRISRWDRLDELEKQVSFVVQKIEQAGDDEAALRALGIFEADGETKAEDDGSASATKDTA
jgi:hypothetical protein